MHLRFKRDAGGSIRDVQNIVDIPVDARNAEPKPFRWTNSADDILASI